MVSPAYPRHRVPDDLRKCASCGLTVMAKGDWQGWKGVDMGEAQMSWFCDKAICGLARDQAIAKRTAEMAAAQGQKSAGSYQHVAEVAKLNARIAELEGRAAGQSTASPAVEPPDENFGDVPESDQGVMPLPPEPEKTNEKGEGSKHVGQLVHTMLNGQRLCDLTDDAPNMEPQNLPFDCLPCGKCIDAWTEIQSGERKAPGAVALPSPELPAEAAAEPPDYGAMTKFNQDFIARVVDGERPQGGILVAPSIYPDLDMKRLNPEQLRDALGSFFDEVGLKVGTIERAERGDEFLGVAFTLVVTDTS